MKRTAAIIFLFIMACLSMQAQSLSVESDSLAREKKKALINDYSIVGINYGATFSSMMFNPAMHNQAWIFSPSYVSLTWTRYSKLFGYLPNFGLTLGAAYGREGFAFKTDKETGRPSGTVDGADWCTMEVFEIPALCQIHADAAPFKVMANVGVYGGYRSSITRRGSALDPAYANSFRTYEHRLDYGLQGGAGIALMFDPIEIHVNGTLRWSWSSLYDPDYYSQYYYRYAYPLDVMVTVGVYYQITKRMGRTRRQIRSEAYSRVYGASTDN